MSFLKNKLYIPSMKLRLIIMTPLVIASIILAAIFIWFEGERNGEAMFLVFFVALFSFGIPLAYFYKFLGKVELLVQTQQSTLIANSKMASLGEMASGMAHEINNPLTIIQLITDQTSKMLAMGEVDQEILKFKFNKIGENSRRITKIVNGLRTFASEEDNQVFTSVDIGIVIDHALNLSRERFKNNNISLKAENIPQVNYAGNAVEISHVLLNVLNNSYDAVANSEDKWVKISALDNDDFIELQISDSGKGIEAPLSEKIFQPFFTTKEIGQGAGLGLSLAKGIIQKHKGSIYLDQKKPHTTFVIRLPKFMELKPSLSEA
jgi:C4-dicarboxylate-specific signal transduction histidine kinase